MAHNHSTHAWIGSFAGRLLQLQPEMSIGLAVHCAITGIHYASELDPFRAAELFALANPSMEAIFSSRAALSKRPSRSRGRVAARATVGANV